jgi:LuxR family maltose regulon positive regulatory protein
MENTEKPLTLINTKLRIPRVSSDLVPRSQLIKRLNDGLNRKLTLVSAPAGYGKTTILCQWLADSTYPVAWLSLDENDDNLYVFLSYFVAAIQTIFPEAGQATLSILGAYQKPPLDHLTGILINELDELGEPFVLVLDDYYNIFDAEVHQFLDALITYMPSGMHLVLASRKDFPLPVVRLRIGRELSEIRVLDLRFSAVEVKAYIEQTTGIKLSRDMVAVLEERTEGWIAALCLAAIAMRGETDQQHFLRSFKGSHRDLMNYLVSEVLSQQSENVQAFLLKTSILSRFSAPLIGAVIDQSTYQGQEIIKRLEQANLFIVPLDDERGWYRYHHLFREMLNHRLQVQLSKEAIMVLHNSASVWLGQHGFIDEAIRHALAAENVSGATELIDHQRHDLLDQSNWRLLERWLTLLPDQVVGKEPTLLVLQAWLLLHTLKLGEMNLVLQEAEKRLDDDVAKFPKAKALALRGEIDTMRSYFWNVVGNDPQQGFECAQRALKNLPQTHSFALGMALDFECFAYYFSGQKDRAIRLLSDAAYNPNPLGPSKLQTFIGLCHLYLISGNLPQLLQTADNFLQMAVENKQTIGIAYAHYFIGFARYEWNEVDKATHHFSKVAELHYGASAIAFKNSLYPLALAYQYQGESGKAQDTMDALQAYFREIENTSFLPEMRSVQARLSLLRGDLAPAVRWVEAVNLDDLRDSPFVFEVQGITWSSVRIAQGTTNSLLEATRYLRKILATAENSHNIRWMIRTLVHLALAYAAQGQKKEALDALERSVKLAQPGGFIRTFVYLGTEIEWMLRQLMIRGVAIHYIKRILAAFLESDSKKVPLKDDPAHIVYESSKTILIEPLTRRESEILLQLSGRQTNKEIADNLNISILTVKKHTGNIYQKLGVNRRGEAVDKSKALGILPT